MQKIQLSGAFALTLIAVALTGQPAMAQATMVGGQTTVAPNGQIDARTGMRVLNTQQPPANLDAALNSGARSQVTNDRGVEPNASFGSSSGIGFSGNGTSVGDNSNISTGTKASAN